MVLVANFALGCTDVISVSNGMLPSCRLTVNCLFICPGKAEAKLSQQLELGQRLNASSIRLCACSS